MKLGLEAGSAVGDWLNVFENMAFITERHFQRIECAVLEGSPFQLHCHLNLHSVGHPKHLQLLLGDVLESSPTGSAEAMSFMHMDDDPIETLQQRSEASSHRHSAGLCYEQRRDKKKIRRTEMDQRL